ncbi:MAG: phospho-sugar mutase [Oscillospiraceae bacterium]|nr:phospho-sugar mutase [Oscillospiraceae bacterium]
MLDFQKEYRNWLNNADSATRLDLSSLNDAEIQDRFYRTLEFGTGGLRGVIGAGLNRINKYVVGQATQGLANQLLKTSNNSKCQGVAIAYDSRNMSPEFAEEAAAVLAANGIKVYLFESLRPTPELSFAVRYLNCASGIVITASHNPAKYNGYKVYGADGSQITPETSNIISSEIAGTDIFGGVRHMDFESAKTLGFIEIVGESIDRAYIDRVKEQSVNPSLVSVKGGDYTLVYTPLHGSGNLPVRRVLDEIGFKNVIVVSEQELPDGNFPTVKSPNPEEKEGFAIAIKYAEIHNADLIIATDPDGDRVGIAVKDAYGKYRTMTGNQVGVLLTEYISSQGSLPENGTVVKTIVTTDMVRGICQKYGLELAEVLTGFKYIGEKIMEFEESGDKTFVFGFEESYGYLKGTYARDKDAVVASMLIAEMALYYQMQGLTLYEQMQNLYNEYGYYTEDLISVTMEGASGIEKIKGIMENLRSVPPKKIGGLKVSAVRDYKTAQKRDIVSDEIQAIFLPKSDVLYFELENGNSFVARPSGTEPKIKFYLMCRGESETETENLLENIKEWVKQNI